MIALRDIASPIFALGTVRDHIAPWRSVYKVTLFADTDVTYALVDGGHNAGIVSEPGHARRHYRVATRADGDPHIDPETWLRQRPVKEGSWWPEWSAWLHARSSPPSAVPGMGAPERGLVPLGDAPGAYVMQR